MDSKLTMFEYELDVEIRVLSGHPALSRGAREKAEDLFNRLVRYFENELEDGLVAIEDAAYVARKADVGD